MDAIVSPGALSGEVVAPSSKSEAHRALICAAFANGVTNIDCSSTSKDIEATISCLDALGARVAKTGEGFRVNPVPRRDDSSFDATPSATLDCGESGSTLRFLLPVVAALGRGASMVGHGRLPERPLSPLYEQLVAHGVTLTPQGTNPLVVGGRLDTSAEFLLPGDVSSQYVSGLLLAAPIRGHEVVVNVVEPVESRPYIDLTVSALRHFGVEVEEAHVTFGEKRVRRYAVHEGSRLVSPKEMSVGGDWSNSAFWLAAGALSESGVAVTGVDVASAQGDRAVMGALALQGARVVRGVHGAACQPEMLHGCTLDVSSCPDLVPPLAAVAACAEGTTRIVGAARLRIKESDRLQTVSQAICAMGGDARVTDDGLVINGGQLTGGVVDAANDHRIAMMAAVLATRASGPTKIVGAECVAKSYPAFFEDFSSLGGAVRKES